MFAVVLLISAGCVAAQSIPAATSSASRLPFSSSGSFAPPPFSPIGNLLSKPRVCSPYHIQSAKELSFEQRACYLGQRLAAPSMVLRAAFSGAYGQWRNNDPHVGNENMDDFGRRFGSFYARHTAQSAGELLAGYFHHEDPRPHVSGQHGFWIRTRAALLGVFVSPDEDGNKRVALIPIAGALGEGFTGMAVSERHDHLNDGLRRTGFSYGGYFGTAMMREFQPDLSNLASRLVHKKKPD